MSETTITYLLYGIIGAVLMLAFLCGCEIHPLGTQAKLQALQRAQYHGRHASTHHRRSPTPQGSAYVSPQWLDTYRQLESEHGDYTIPDDHNIHVSSDGRIKVPTTVIRHFNDLSKAPVQAEPPQ